MFSASGVKFRAVCSSQASQPMKSERFQHLTSLNNDNGFNNDFHATQKPRNSRNAVLCARASVFLSNSLEIQHLSDRRAFGFQLLMKLNFAQRCNRNYLFSPNSRLSKILSLLGLDHEHQGRVAELYNLEFEIEIRFQIDYPTYINKSLI